MWDERKGGSGRRIFGSGAEIKIEEATEGETFLNKSKLSHQNNTYLPKCSQRVIASSPETGPHHQGMESSAGKTRRPSTRGVSADKGKRATAISHYLAACQLLTLCPFCILINADSQMPNPMKCRDGGIS